MNIPDMDWYAGWSDDIEAQRNADWADEWERGYEDGMYAILEVFEKELYIATKEDPHYAAYVEDAIKIIKKVINPALKD
jgi:hypothetical protein